LMYQTNAPGVTWASVCARPADTEGHPVDLVLDHRRRVDRELAHGPEGQTPAARLVPGKSRLVDEQHAHATAGEVDSGHRACRTCADHRDVVALHLPNRSRAPERRRIGWRRAPRADERLH